MGHDPPIYPIFGKYHKTISETRDNIADTGMLLYALLSYTAAASHQELAN
jgi:hypothetical protein